MTYKRYLIIGLLPFLLFSGCRQQQKINTELTNPVPPVSEEVKPAGDSTLHAAALNGNIHAVRDFISKGIKPDSEDQDGRTALMYASYNGHTDLARELINMGANVNRQDKYGRTALIFASSGPHPATVKVLLDNKANPDIADSEERYTALMYAAAEGHMENVRILLAYNSDPYLKDVDGDSAMTFATRNKHTDIAKLLRSFAHMQENLKKDK